MNPEDFVLSLLCTCFEKKNKEREAKESAEASPTSTFALTKTKAFRSYPLYRNKCIEKKRKLKDEKVCADVGFHEKYNLTKLLQIR